MGVLRHLTWWHCAGQMMTSGVCALQKNLEPTTLPPTTTSHPPTVTRSWLGQTHLFQRVSPSFVLFFLREKDVDAIPETMNASRVEQPHVRDAKRFEPHHPNGCLFSLSTRTLSRIAPITVEAFGQAGGLCTGRDVGTPRFCFGAWRRGFAEMLVDESEPTCLCTTWIWTCQSQTTED